MSIVRLSENSMTASVGGELSDPSASHAVARNTAPAARSPLAGAISLVGGLTGLLAHNGLLNGNLRTVIEGQVYRSAQLSPRKLNGVLRRYGIRTVISLRGGDEGDDWFRDQAAVCAAQQVRLERISLTAMRLPRPGHIKKLIRFFDEAEHPLLFHCRGGADRSGLAATIYLHLYAGLSLDEAQRQGLTWKYGHLPLQAAAMDEFFDLYRAESGGLSLREWVMREYPALFHRELQKAANQR